MTTPPSGGHFLDSCTSAVKRVAREVAAGSHAVDCPPTASTRGRTKACSCALGALVVLAACLLAPHPVRAAPDGGPGQTVPAPPSAQQRYDEARRLMQRGRYAEAGEVYREVAEAEEAPVALRAQALYAAGLMQENTRDYERAVAIYHEVVRRFPDTEFARRAGDQVKTLEEGGAGRGLEFRRRQDAAWSELSPAREQSEREGAQAARPRLERAAELFTDILHDFPDHPKAKEVAVTLGD